MCGIIAHLGDGDALEPLLTGLENLEYRGYDSAGVAIQNGGGIDVEKRSGTVADLKRAIDAGPLHGHVGIGHTRWSTHGAPTDENAHPHTDHSQDVAVVHNGIIDNHAELKHWLATAGHQFTSDTDTEVIPHLIQYYIDEGLDTESAFRRSIERLEGSYAVAAMRSGESVLYAARNGSPLVIGIEDDATFLASDVPAFLEYTDRVVYLEDGDVVVVEPEGVRVTDLEGTPISREHSRVEWDPEEAGKGGYDHFMRKEIEEQPTSLAQTIEGRIDPATGTIDLESVPVGTFADVDRVQFVACGTSYHAGLYGAIACNNAGVPATALLANEYSTGAPPVDEDTLVVAVTQSGETADTLSALRDANAAGARTLTVTNVIGSTAAREADDRVLIRAGPEIGVAATKTFSSQTVILLLLAELIRTDVQGEPSADRQSMLSAVASLPSHVGDVIERSQAASIAQQFHASDAYFFLGRGLGYPVALEGALKFKEITYEHAEGFASGELKHGPLALVTPKTPVFAVFTGVEDDKVLANAEEAGTRGAPIVSICPEAHVGADVADASLWIPETHPLVAGLLANVQLQLLSYHAATLLDRPIDKPRNLAKSVTVQ